MTSHRNHYIPTSCTFSRNSSCSTWDLITQLWLYEAEMESFKMPVYPNAKMSLNRISHDLLPWDDNWGFSKFQFSWQICPIYLQSTKTRKDKMHGSLMVTNLGISHGLGCITSVTWPFTLTALIVSSSLYCVFKLVILLSLCENKVSAHPFLKWRGSAPENIIILLPRSNLLEQCHLMEIYR